MKECMFSVIGPEDLYVQQQSERADGDSMGVTA